MRQTYTSATTYQIQLLHSNKKFCVSARHNWNLSAIDLQICDESKKLQDDVQKITDSSIKNIENLTELKEKEILKV